MHSQTTKGTYFNTVLISQCISELCLVIGERVVTGCIHSYSPVRDPDSDYGECDTPVCICVARDGIHIVPACYTV
jgi:hypothetical protein